MAVGDDVSGAHRGLPVTKRVEPVVHAVGVDKLDGAHLGI